MFNEANGGLFHKVYIFYNFVWPLYLHKAEFFLKSRETSKKKSPDFKSSFYIQSSFISPLTLVLSLVTILKQSQTANYFTSILEIYVLQNCFTYLLYKEIFRLSMSSWMNFDNMCVPKKVCNSLKLSNLLA